MIVIGRYTYTPTCDGCGEELEPQYNYRDAVAEMKKAGWATGKPDKLCPEWYNLCPVCKERRAKRNEKF